MKRGGTRYGLATMELAGFEKMFLTRVHRHKRF